MKLFKISLAIIKWIAITGLLLFSLATWMAGSYLQSFVMLLVIAALIYWPSYLAGRFGKLLSLTFRILFILALFSLNFFVFTPKHKTTIYTSEENKESIYSIYDSRQLHEWPAGTRDRYIETAYGVVHLLSCGSPDNPPVVLLHAASMGAHSWAENIQPLLDHYCIYAIDNIGEGNKSQLRDAEVFPDSGEKLADLYAALMDSLNIDKAPVIGASNGGYIAQVLAYHHPEKVESLVLLSPMGLTPLTGGSIFMMSVGSMYPFPFIRRAVTTWAIGSDDYCNRKYGDWFDAIIRGTIPSFARPESMTADQKERIQIPVLLFLGTHDPIVGDADAARIAAQDYQDIQTVILSSGHLIAVEQRDTVNQLISGFFGRQQMLPVDSPRISDGI